jgi:hypothetical protein
MSRDLEFIHYLFRTILHREPSPDEHATWTQKTAEPSFQALSYDSIAQAFQASDEARQTPPQTSRNLILGFCAHYTLDQVLPFLASARTHHPSAAIVLIAHSMPQDFVDWCQANRVRLVAVPPDDPSGVHPQSARYFHYRDFLTRWPGVYDRILLTDVRDVWFQGDCFACPWPGDLVCAAESATLISNPCNSLWASALYGEYFVEAHGGRPISCSGTTFGTYPAILDYLEKLCIEIGRKPALHRIAGFDQGAHNYLVHSGKLPHAVLDEPMQLVATLTVVQSDRIELLDGRILVDKHPSPVIHQWDRHDSLKRFMAASYPRLQPLHPVAV